MPTLDRSTPFAAAPVGRRQVRLNASVGRLLSEIQMPEISRFLGIVIGMFFNDHSPPHFHARYGEHEIRVNIETGDIMTGKFPRRAEKLVAEWLSLHRDELLEDWTLATARKPLKKIEPLE